MKMGKGEIELTWEEWEIFSVMGIPAGLGDILDKDISNTAAMMYEADEGLNIINIKIRGRIVSRMFRKGFIEM